MLKQLYIQNYAIIDEISIDFSTGLNIITGETGAGKSILMGALGLILGDRADSAALLNKEKKSIVEGRFSTEGRKAIITYLNQQELDAEEELVIRREFAPNGKSRSFVNDTPVSLQQLKALSGMLVDLHRQFDTLDLGEDDFQRNVVDALAGNFSELKSYASFYQQYINAKQILTQLKVRQQQANATLDYHQFLFTELEEANFEANELETLEAEIKLLNHAEQIKQQLAEICFVLNENESPIVQTVKTLANKVGGITAILPALQELYDRLMATQVELQDIAAELEHANDKVVYNADRIQLVNDKLALGYRLLKKHNVQTTAALIEIKAQLEQQLLQHTNLEVEIATKEKEVEALLQTCSKLANAISLNRKAAIPGFTEKVNLLLAQVGMPNARLKVDIQAQQLDQYGIDLIHFVFDANKSNRFELLSKVASGGELSRIMLCIKSLVAKKLQLPTLIFDEIDTGISGEAARQVAQIMKSLSSAHQLLSITHQPQIAAKADAHYFVFKAVKGNQIATGIRLLSVSERVETIAQMLSGAQPTPAAIQNAKEMLSS
ncbi:MAG: DNA repair protein RecN [Ferruginibacter sp.]